MGAQILCWPSSVTRKDLKWSDWDTNWATEPLNYSLSCLQHVLGQESSRIVIKGTGEPLSSTWLGRSQWVPLRRGRKDWSTREVRGTTRTWPAESTDPDWWDLSVIREHAGMLGLLQIKLWLKNLVLSWDSQQWKQELSLTLLPAYGIGWPGPASVW